MLSSMKLEFFVWRPCFYCSNIKIARSYNSKNLRPDLKLTDTKNLFSRYLLYSIDSRNWWSITVQYCYEYTCFVKFYLLLLSRITFARVETGVLLFFTTHILRRSKIRSEILNLSFLQPPNSFISIHHFQRFLHSFVTAVINSKKKKTDFYWELWGY